MLSLVKTWNRPAQAHGVTIAPVHKAAMTTEIARLNPAQCLVRQDSFEVHIAGARQIPAVLLEVGRLREVAFRLAGEGTGRRVDLDRFDEHYDHLILWDRQNEEVAGAYRLARVVETLNWHGRTGLYTASLFHLKPAFFERLGPAVELGRSFVNPDYQRQAFPLLLLWRGIGRYLERYPECRSLFGPVSISGSYSPEARRALSDFFASQAAADPLRSYVRPRCPLPGTWFGWRKPHVCTTTLAGIDELVRSVGGDAAKRGLPVLLRQYLKLGGRVLCCSVDPAFGHCLDALIVVDLGRIDQQRFARLMGLRGETPRLAEV